MKTLTFLIVSMLILAGCGGGMASSTANNVQNGANTNPAAFETPPTPGKLNSGESAA